MPLADIAKQFTAANQPGSEVELVGEVPFEALGSYREHALKHLVERAEMPGFRPGKVPEEMVLKRLGEQTVLEEAVEMFVKDFYPALLEEKAIDAVGRPEIKVTKLASGNPVGLTIRATVYPEVSLPKHWRDINQKVPLEPSLPASDEEVQQTLESLQKSRAQKSPLEGTPDIMPELNDEFAKSLGAFPTLAALKEQIKKGISEEKAHKARDARRGRIIEALLAGTSVEVPRMFVESELDKIMAQMREDITRMGLKYEDYLKHANKTEDDIRREFKEQAAKRAKLQLTLNKIAVDEKVEADPTAIEHEMKHALEHFPDANPELLGIHIQTVLKNELVLKMLEGEVKGEPLKV